MSKVFAMMVAAVLLAACASNQGASTQASAQASDGSAASGGSSADVASTTSGDLYYGAHLPNGPERTALKVNCEICHSGDMYASQRLSKVVWNAEVTKMMKFGSPLPKTEKARVVAYLAKYLGPTVPRSDAVPTATAPPISYGQAPAQ